MSRKVCFKSSNMAALTKRNEAALSNLTLNAGRKKDRSLGVNRRDRWGKERRDFFERELKR